MQDFYDLEIVSVIDVLSYMNMVLYHINKSGDPEDTSRNPNGSVAIVACVYEAFGEYL